MNHAYDSVTIYQLPSGYPRKTKPSEEAVSSIGGQQEVIIVPDVTDRIVTPKK